MAWLLVVLVLVGGCTRNPVTDCALVRLDECATGVPTDGPDGLDRACVERLERECGG